MHFYPLLSALTFTDFVANTGASFYEVSKTSQLLARFNEIRTLFVSIKTNRGNVYEMLNLPAQKIMNNHAKKGKWTTLAKIELVLSKLFVDTVKMLWDVFASFKTLTN